MMASMLIRCALAVLSAAGATAAAADCVRITQIRSFETLDRSNLLLDAGLSEYHVRLRGFCLELEHSLLIGYVDGDRDGQLCSALRDGITVGSLRRETCGIGSIDRLTEQEAQQLRIRHGRREGVRGVIEETMPEPESDAESEDGSGDGQGAGQRPDEAAGAAQPGEPPGQEEPEAHEEPEEPWQEVGDESHSPDRTDAGGGVDARRSGVYSHFEHQGLRRAG